MSVFGLPSNFCECKAPLLLRHGSIEGIDAAMCYRISRGFVALENRRQVLQRLLLPGRHVGDDVTHRPFAGHTRLGQL